MADLATVAAVAGLAASGIQAYGTIAAGNAEADALESAANIEAAQLEARGLEEQVASQQEANRYRRQRDLALSALQARAAAGGFSATSEDVLDLTGDIAEYGTLQEQLARYGGANARKRYNYSAKTTRQGAQSRASSIKQGAKLAAVGQVLGSFSSFGSSMSSPKYGSYSDTYS